VENTEENRRKMFGDWQEEIPEHVQIALYEEHCRLTDRLIEKNPLTVDLSEEYQPPAEDYEFFEKESNAREELEKFLYTDTEPCFDSDNHVGSVYQAAFFANAEDQEPLHLITPRQIGHAAHIFISVIESKIPEKYRSEADIENLLFEVTEICGERAFDESDDDSSAAMIVGSLRLSRTLEIIARIPEIDQKTQGCLLGLSRICYASAQEVLGDFIRDNMKGGNGPSGERFDYK
jgi:hypothetical protein